VPRRVSISQLRDLPRRPVSSDVARVALIGQPEMAATDFRLTVLSVRENKNGWTCRTGDGWNARHWRRDLEDAEAARLQRCRNYAGNDVAAQAFKEETGIAVYKFDVSDHAAVTAAVAQIEKDLGPIEIVVNNAGITRDSTMRRLSRDMWTR